MNRGQLKTRVSRILRVGIGSSDDVAGDTALIEEVLNEAVIDVLTRTRVHTRVAEVVLTAGVDEFDVDPVMMRVWGIERGSDGVVMEEQDLADLDADGYAYVSYSRIKLGQAGTGEFAYMRYTPRPTAMTADGNDPATVTYGNIPSEFHRALLNYALWHTADSVGDQQAGRGERYRAMYEGQDGLAGPGTDLGRIKTAINVRGGAVHIRRHREILASDRDTSYWQG